MSVAAEVAVRAFLAEMEGGQWDSAQIERVLARMAPDARFQVIAWHEALVGHDAIREGFERQALRIRDLRIEIVALASADRMVFTERLDSMTMNGTAATFHVAGVFEVDDAGKIGRWRDYVDTREVASELRPAASAGDI